MKNVLRMTMLFTIILSIAFLTGHPNMIRAADKPIVIGGSLPLTGKYADTAKWIERGMEFWADEVNAKGGVLGRKVAFKIYDDESSAGKAVTFAEKAITVDKVDLLFGGYPGTAAGERGWDP
jgi:branched-chain amino acid transport system substrate-binding protein